MNNIDLIYQYLKEYSKETVEQFDDLMDQAEEDNIFSEEDISGLCNLLFSVERDLENESSYNIDWTIKDRITETIIILTLKNKSATHFETIAKAINKYRTISRPYLETVIETFLTVFLLGSPDQSEDEIAQNRSLLLKAMKDYTQDYKEIIKSFCQSNLEQLKSDKMEDELPPQVKKLKSSLSEIYNLV